ncbi:MAG: hypothetical protein ABIL37_04150 [candidate division WOR-3 bacterium]
MLFYLISTIIRQEALGNFKIITDETERIYFPSSQLIFSNMLQFEITYKKAYFTFPILENFVYSFYFDTIYGGGLAYKLRNIDLGLNSFYVQSEVKLNLGLSLKALEKHQIKFSMDYFRDSVLIRGFASIALEQISFKFYGEYKNNFIGIFAISYEPTAYRFLTFGIFNLSKDIYTFSNVEFFIYRNYLMLRGGVWQNLKTSDYNINYGFSIFYNNMRSDFILNEKEFKIGVSYLFKVF